MSGFEAWNEFNKRFRMILDSEISFSPPLTTGPVSDQCLCPLWLGAGKTLEEPA